LWVGNRAGVDYPWDRVSGRVRVSIQSLYRAHRAVLPAIARHLVVVELHNGIHYTEQALRLRPESRYSFVCFCISKILSVF